MLIDKLKQLITDVSRNISEQQENELDTFITKRGYYQMQPYMAPVNQPGDFVGEHLYTLACFMKGTFIHEAFAKTIFLNENKGTSTRPLPLSDLSGVQRNCVSQFLFEWNGLLFKDDKRVDAKAIDNHSFQQTNTFVMDCHHLCESNFVMQEELLNTGKLAYDCSYWPEKRINTKPLIPFGYYFDPSLELTKCMPMFAMLDGGEKTSLGIKASSFWARHGLSPSHPAIIGDLAYEPVGMSDVLGAVSQLSCAERLNNGELTLIIEDQKLQSCGYTVINKDSGLIHIHFQA